MDNSNRKLIGTIVGVIFFIVLIAGATFAWLTYIANIENSGYSIRAENFVVNYTSGNDITYLPILLADVTTIQYSSAGGQTISGNAYKGEIDGTLYLKLHVNDTPDSEHLVGSECIRYAVFYDCLAGLLSNQSIISQTQNGILSSDEIDENGDIVIFSGPLLAINRVTPSYTVYLWIDNELATSQEMGLTFSGYVHAYAIQDDPNS